MREDFVADVTGWFHAIVFPFYVLLHLIVAGENIFAFWTGESLPKVNAMRTDLVILTTQSIRDFTGIYMAKRSNI